MLQDYKYLLFHQSWFVSPLIVIHDTLGIIKLYIGGRNMTCLFPDHKPLRYLVGLRKHFWWDTISVDWDIYIAYSHNSVQTRLFHISSQRWLLPLFKWHTSHQYCLGGSDLLPLSPIHQSLWILLIAGLRKQNKCLVTAPKAIFSVTQIQ